MVVGGRSNQQQQKKMLSFFHFHQIRSSCELWVELWVEKCSQWNAQAIVSGEQRWWVALVYMSVWRGSVMEEVVFQWIADRRCGAKFFNACRPNIQPRHPATHPPIQSFRQHTSQKKEVTTNERPHTTHTPTDPLLFVYHRAVFSSCTLALSLSPSTSPPSTDSPLSFFHSLSLSLSCRLASPHDFVLMATTTVHILVVKSNKQLHKALELAHI